MRIPYRYRVKALTEKFVVLELDRVDILAVEAKRTVDQGKGDLAYFIAKTCYLEAMSV